MATRAGWVESSAHRWYGGSGQGTVLEFDKPTSSKEHPTMKPPELFARLIRSSTKKGDIVLDMFCGSGPAILAAESYARRCRAMELSPHNCDVIIAQWEAQTGKTAIRLEGGEANGRTKTAGRIVANQGIKAYDQGGAASAAGWRGKSAQAQAGACTCIFA